MNNLTVSGLVGLKVLVIDDSNTIRRSAEIFLKQGGYDVLLAEDGFDALSKVNDNDPDLIFCDILMPRLDGYQTCAIIKRNAKFAAVPVIMLSSNFAMLAFLGLSRQVAIARGQEHDNSENSAG